MKIGIVGTPLCGKSTMFQALTGLVPDPSKYHGVKPQPGIVKVPDTRLDFLTELYMPKKRVPAITEFLDFVGIGLGSRTETLKTLLGEVRTLSDALVIVLKAFDDNNYVKDYENLLSEFLFSDLEMIEKRVSKLQASLIKPTKTHKEERKELEFLERLQKHLEENENWKGFEMSKEDDKSIRGFKFLSQKPRIIVLNSDDASRISDTKIKDAIVINAEVEKEIVDLNPDEQKEFLAEFNITELSRNIIIEKAFEILNTIRFYTYGSDECRAWELKTGSNAVEAAGCIHSDLARGFIRAEVFTYDDIEKYKSEKEIKANGKLRLEGKDYIVKDGDILTIRFSV
ncbi:MAG: DUF933 domain-containing protein [Planctomycetes bacterium]|nr:DUF933 domain-containing protein [Planctomycetota bacterium]